MSSGVAEALDELGKPKTLIIDIETIAPLVYSWGLRKANIGVNQIVKPGRVICFAAKWDHERKIRFHSEHHDGREEMVAEAWRLLDEADVVVGWNSDRFDVKHLNREFVQAFGKLPTPHRGLDLMKAWNKKFATSSGSYKLDAVLLELGLERKLDAGGFELWFGCDRGDEKAWRDMRAYCRHDVKATASLLDYLRPHIAPFPHAGLYGGNRAGCPRCGAVDPEQIGYSTKQTGRYLSFRCRECGGVFEGTHRVEAVHHRAT